MVGVKTFDMADAERGLMRAFWAKGYAGAGIADLEAATGLKRGSLYNAFGDKEAMFRTAFARYGAEIEEAALDAMDAAPTLAEGIDALFGLLRTGLEDAPPGCLVARAVGELGANNGAAGAAVRERLATTRERFAERIREAVSAGELLPTKDAAALAGFLLGQMRAFSLLRGAGEEAAAEAVAEVARKFVALSGR